ncbi:YcxB family protein [Dokdonella sp. MW10]|uniref:YcxB family protein n=1 Tax=Dokdonella sp. MW10 TaxID=2992926 RepID=UPI003F80DF22
MTDPHAVAFTVRYRLREYLAFVVEHAFDVDPELRAAGRWKRVQARVLMVVVATFAFAIKSLRLGRCTFVIDARGLTRGSRLGTASVPWARVKALHAYRPGFLLELAEGAVPLPYRAFDAVDRERIRAFAAAGIPVRVDAASS